MSPAYELSFSSGSPERRHLTRDHLNFTLLKRDEESTQCHVQPRFLICNSTSVSYFRHKTDTSELFDKAGLK